MSGKVLAFEVALEVAQDRVFAALTDARELERWFCDACESEPCAGGRLVMRWTRSGGSREAFVARWLELVPNRRAAYRGGHAGYPDGDAGTVGFVLEVRPADTRLLVQHELPASQGYEAMLESWRAAWPRALGRLQNYLALVRPTAD